jgi:RimJ/RimL family protein N-acetyltransferase
MSLNKKKIKLDEHKIWFHKKIKVKGHLWIFSFKNKKCGVVYLNKKKNLEIGYLLSKNYRNKGLSSIMLNLFVRKFKKYRKNIKIIVARVLKNNNKSLRALQSAGFLISSKKEGSYILKKKYD